jgi:hypothetical protein
MPCSKHYGSLEVEELTLSLEVTAKGSVSLLGTGGELGGTGGISLTLKRRGVAAARATSGAPSPLDE